MTEPSASVGVMPESDRLQTAPPNRGARSSLFIGTLAFEGLAFAALLWLLVTGDGQSATRQLQIFLSVVALLATTWNVLHRERVWRVSLRQLLNMVPLVRAGVLPMDSLKTVDGKLAPVAAEILELVQELRQQRVEVANLENDLRQKVASRTDALERKLGSLRQQATRDALTGLFNRRMLDEHLPQTLKRCYTTGDNAALLMIDVDYFKHLNDTRGHAAGDELLRSIGQIIRSTLRDEDAAFRYGGDEFAVIVEGPGALSAQMLADRLVSLVDSLAATLHVTPAPRLSIGVAILSEVFCPTTQAFIERADKALYEIKTARHGGRQGLRSGRAEVQSPVSSR